MQTAEILKKQGVERCGEILRKFDNKKNLAESIAMMNKKLSKLAVKGTLRKSEGE